MTDAVKHHCAKVAGIAQWKMPPAMASVALQLVRNVCERAMELRYADVADNRAAASAAVLLAAASESMREPEYGQAALDLMDHALARLDIANHALFGGATGVIWSAIEVDAYLGLEEYRAIGTCQGSCRIKLF